MFGLILQTCGILSLAGLLTMGGLMLRAQRRRRQASRAARGLGPAVRASSARQVRQLQRAARASDTLESTLRLAYFLLAIAAATASVGLGFTDLSASLKSGMSVAALVVTSLAAVFVLRHWQSDGEGLDRTIRSRLRDAEEGLLSRRGLSARDAATGLYSLEFVLHGLETRLGRLLRRPRPITCVLLHIEGLDAIRLRLGQAQGEDIVQRLGEEVRRNLRADDLVARAGTDRILMALMRCPRKFGPTVSRRVITNVQRLLLHGLNRQHQVELALVSVYATIPDDASTPVELVHLVESDLEIKRSLLAVRWQDRDLRLAGQP